MTISLTSLVDDSLLLNSMITGICLSSGEHSGRVMLVWLIGRNPFGEGYKVPPEDCSLFFLLGVPFFAYFDFSYVLGCYVLLV